MAVTLLGIKAPDLPDPFNPVGDMNVLGATADTAIRMSLSRGSAAQRASFTATATNGTLWQDTDGIKMVWRKDGTIWVPGVWKWAGTLAQMNSFTQAPAGFEWYNTTDAKSYTRVAGAWTVALNYFQAVHSVVPGTIQQSGAFYYTGLNTVTFPAGKFTTVPQIYLQSHSTGITGASIAEAPTTTSVTFQVYRLGAAPTASHKVNVLAIQ